MNNFYKYFLGTWKQRFFVLIILPLLISLSTFVAIGSSSIIHQNIQTRNSLSGNLQPTSTTDNSIFFSSIAEILKIPLFFINFDVYAQNKETVIDLSGEIPMIMNVNFDGIYIGGIKYDEVKKISEINISELAKNISVETSFDYSSIPKNVINEKEGAYYSIFVQPTLTSFILFWISLIAFIYGTIAFVTVCVKFVVKGSPIVEIFD